MPDPAPAPDESSWIVRALLVIERIAKILAPTVAAGLALWAVNVGKDNQKQGAEIRQVQTENREDAETKAKKDARANEIKLYEAWKNLEWLADDSGKATDKAKAAEAKRVYEEFIAHKNGS